MRSWFAGNWGTIFVLIVLVAVVAAIVRKLYTDRKSGGSCASCGACAHRCGGCAATGSCHSQTDHAHK